MGSVDESYDNAMAERFFAKLECELIDRHRFETPVEVRRAIFEFTEGWYNPLRRHSGTEHLSPAHYQRRNRSPTSTRAPQCPA